MNNKYFFRVERYHPIGDYYTSPFSINREKHTVGTWYVQPYKKDEQLSVQDPQGRYGTVFDGKGNFKWNHGAHTGYSVNGPISPYSSLFNYQDYMNIRDNAGLEEKDLFSKDQYDRGKEYIDKNEILGKLNNNERLVKIAKSGNIPLNAFIDAKRSPSFDLITKLDSIVMRNKALKNNEYVNNYSNAKLLENLKLLSNIPNTRILLVEGEYPNIIKTTDSADSGEFSTQRDSSNEQILNEYKIVQVLPNKLIRDYDRFKNANNISGADASVENVKRISDWFNDNISKYVEPKKISDSRYKNILNDFNDRLNLYKVYKINNNIADTLESWRY